MSGLTPIPQNDLLLSLKIAAPCNVSWDSMKGDERVRHCQQCNKNVYNISSMTKVDANEFLQATANMACVNYFRRTDGTILVDNCPVGLRKIRDQFKRLAAAAGALISLGAGLIMSALAEEPAANHTSNQSRLITREPSYNPRPTGFYRTAGRIMTHSEAIETSANSYRKRVEPLIDSAMPKIDLGHAAVSFNIDSTGHTKYINLVSKSPSKETDELIIRAIKSLQLPAPPSEHKQSGLPIYYECHEAHKLR